MNGKFMYSLWMETVHSLNMDICLIHSLCRMFEQEMINQNPRVRVENVWGHYEEQFPEWFKVKVRFPTMYFA